MTDNLFKVVQKDQAAPEKRRTRLENIQAPPTLHDFEESAKHYQPGDELLTAINTALAVEAPLLLTGEPGTGKTQVAYYLKWYFDIQLFSYQVRSDSTVEDMKYDFDAVGYLHYAQSDAYTDKNEKPKTRMDFLKRKALWEAFECTAPCVLLIDEIDKAPRDFPNDLLQELDQYRFKHPFEDKVWIPVVRKRRRPIVVVTSNVERRLPDAFLRRCVYHDIKLTDDLIESAVKARCGDFPNLSDDIRKQAKACFNALRGDSRIAGKKPTTGELLVWLAVLSARGVVGSELDKNRLGQLPCLSVLIKDSEDMARLQSGR